MHKKNSSANQRHPCLYLLVMLVLMTSGCASVFSRQQDVLVLTDKEGSSLKQDGIEKGLAPGVLHLRRGRHSQIVVQHQQEQKEIRLRGRYRWMDSFLGNILLGFFGAPLVPIGMTVDWATGAMWEYPDEVFVGFRASEINEAPPYQLRSIAIAPPLASDFFLSQEMGKIVQQMAARRYKVEVRDLQATMGDFQTFGHTFRERNRDLRNDLLARLSTSHRLLPATTREGDVLKTRVSLVDMGDREVESFEFQSPWDPQRASLSERFKAWAVDFVPNTFGVGQNVTLWAVVSYDNQANAQHFVRGSNNGILGSGVSVSITNIQQRYYRNFVVPYWRFRPTADFSLAALESLDQLNITVKRLTYARADGGFVPEVGLHIGGTDLSLGLPFVLGLDYALIEDGASPSITSFGLDVGLSLMFSFFVAENWRVRFGTEVRSLKQEFWNRVVRSHYPAAEPVNSAAQSSSFVYLEYYLPQMNAFLFR